MIPMTKLTAIGSFSHEAAELGCVSVFDHVHEAV